MVVSGGLVSGFAVDQQSTICRFYRCLSCLVAVWPYPAGGGGWGGEAPPTRRKADRREAFRLVYIHTYVYIYIYIYVYIIIYLYK